MNRKQLSVVWLIGLVMALFFSGCVSAPKKDNSANDDSGKVRVGGDITLTTVNRKGF